MVKKTIGTYKSIEKNKIPDKIDSTIDIAFLESNLDIILNQYKKSLSQIIDDKRYVKIAVAGRMNHGKSSLLNSLIGDISSKFKIFVKQLLIQDMSYLKTFF